MEDMDKVKEYWERVHGYAMRDEQLYKEILEDKKKATKRKKYGKVKKLVLAMSMIAVIALGVKYQYDNVQKEFEMIKTQIIGATFYVRRTYYEDETITIEDEHTLKVISNEGRKADFYEYKLVKTTWGDVVLNFSYRSYKVNIDDDGSIIIED